MWAVLTTNLQVPVSADLHNRSKIPSCMCRIYPTGRIGAYLHTAMSRFPTIQLRNFSSHFYQLNKGNTMKTMIAMLLASAFVLTGCNTVAGAGKDMERGGEKVQDTAKDVQKKM